MCEPERGLQGVLDPRRVVVLEDYGLAEEKTGGAPTSKVISPANPPMTLEL